MQQDGEDTALNETELSRQAAEAWRQGDLITANRSFAELARTRPSEPRHWMNLGVGCQAMGVMRDALKAFQRAVLLQPGLPRHIANLGSMFDPVDHGKLHSIMVRRLLIADPLDAEARLAQAARALAQGRKQQATSDARLAALLSPDTAQAQFLLASADKTDTGMVTHLQRSLVLVPGDPFGAHRDLERLIGRRTDQALSSSYVAGLFDFYAESFDAHLTGKLRYTAPEVLERLLQSAFGDMDGWADRAVDLGCGTGLCGTMLRPHCRYLLGVDLAPRMIEKARANDAYDDLVVGDVVEVLAGYSAPFDLVIAADVTTYLGALNPLFASVAAGLGPGGRFGLTVHALEAGDFAIGWAGTYQHSATYVEAMAASVGLSVELTERGAMRYDDGQPLETLYYILRKPF